jgi:hypothetical protein
MVYMSGMENIKHSVAMNNAKAPSSNLGQTRLD